MSKDLPETTKKSTFANPNLIKKHAHIDQTMDVLIASYLLSISFKRIKTIKVRSSKIIEITFLLQVIFKWFCNSSAIDTPRRSGEISTFPPKEMMIIRPASWRQPLLSLQKKVEFAYGNATFQLSYMSSSQSQWYEFEKMKLSIRTTDLVPSAFRRYRIP